MIGPYVTTFGGSPGERRRRNYTPSDSPNACTHAVLLAKCFGTRCELMGRVARVSTGFLWSHPHAAARRLENDFTGRRTGRSCGRCRLDAPSLSEGQWA